MNTTELDELLGAARAVRRRYEGDAYLNLAFFTGQQWTRWDGTRLFRVEVDRSFEQTVNNRIRPFVRTEIAKMTRSKPTFIAVPKSASDNDTSASRFAADALEYAWQAFRMAAKLRQALLWSRTTPAGYWKIWWDPSIGKKRPVLRYAEGHEQAGRLVRDQFGAPLDPNGQVPEDAPFEQTQVANGEICVELRSFFHVLVDPHCPESGIEEAEWVAEEAVYSRGWVERHFGQAAADSIQYDQDPTPGAMEARLPFANLVPSTTEKGKGAKVKEFWSPQEHYVWAGQELLLQEANPYPWIPYVGFRATPVPGRFYGDPVVTDLRPIQVSLNMRESQIAEHAGRVGNPPLMVPSTMGEDFDWQGLPGEVIPYQDTGSPTAMPSFMAVPPVGAYIENDVQRQLNSMMEVSGQHEVSQAQVPQGVTAAAAISQLQEADNTRMGPDVADMEESISRAGQMVLWLMGRYYDEGRMLTVSGEDGEWDFRAWKRGITTGVDTVRVAEGSMMPKSQGARQAAIQQFATLFSQNNPGAITPRGWANVLQKMGEGSLEGFFAQLNRDQQQVNDENRRMAQGEPVDINSFDNDSAHVDFHTDFQKTPTYRMLPAQVKGMFEQHLYAHRTRIDMQAAAAAQNAQMLPPGAAPGPPSPPGAGSEPPGVPPSPPTPTPGT